MFYLKHKVHGNVHVETEGEAKALEDKGYVRWPRTKEQKAGIVKRGPGRPPNAPIVPATDPPADPAAT